ncbi:hypothetical protein, partial [Pseudomonas phage ZCPA1]
MPRRARGHRPPEDRREENSHPHPPAGKAGIRTEGGITMAVYTITISDTEGGVLFGMKGPQLHDSEASKLAYALMEASKSIGRELAKLNGAGNGVSCACDECLARRARGEEPQQEIHYTKDKN